MQQNGTMPRVDLAICVPEQEAEALMAEAEAMNGDRSLTMLLNLRPVVLGPLQPSACVQVLGMAPATWDSSSPTHTQVWH